MNKWEDYYTIVPVENPRWKENWVNAASSSEGWRLFEIRDIHNNLIGTYRDSRYAEKQAKYKFKKMQAKLEKILLA